MMIRCCPLRKARKLSLSFRPSLSSALRFVATAAKSSSRVSASTSTGKPASAPHAPVSLRLVVAVVPDGKTRTAIAGLQASLKPLLDETRITWLPKEHLLFPLQSYTDLSATSVPPLQRALEQAVRTIKPFEVTLRGIGVVPSWRKPRTLWIGVDKGRDKLKQLGGAIEKAAAEVAIKRREVTPFTPRFPIGTWSDVYVKELNSTEYRDSCVLQGNRFTSTWIVKEIALLQSTLSHDGEIYKPLLGVSLRN